MIGIGVYICYSDGIGFNICGINCNVCVIFFCVLGVVIFCFGISCCKGCSLILINYRIVCNSCCWVFVYNYCNISWGYIVVGIGYCYCISGCYCRVYINCSGIGVSILGILCFVSSGNGGGFFLVNF